MSKNNLEIYLNKRGTSLLASKVENISSLNSVFYQKHELVGELENGTAERVEVATKNAVNIFKKLFSKQSNELLILIYEFPEPNAFGAENKFLHERLSNYKMVDNIKMEEFEIFIYQAQYLSLNFQSILRAIANTEMGFEPGIDQLIYFFDCDNEKAFYMYDDRGCLTNGL